MRVPATKTITLTAVLGVLAGSFSLLRAADDMNVGIVRISDQPTPRPESAPLPPDWNQGQSPSASCPGCPYCGHRVLPGCSDTHQPCPVCIWLFHKGGCTYSPDYGWSRPAKYPIRRAAVEYRRYWPKKWYGEPNSGFAANRNFPVVYMPTDTTQLGYYYQRFPTWHANPAMLPTPPWPSTWHRRECPDGTRPCRNRDLTPSDVPTSPAPKPPDKKQENPPVPPVPKTLKKSADIWNRQPVPF